MRTRACTLPHPGNQRERASDRPNEHAPEYAIDQWVAACRGEGPEPLASFPRQETATEALLLGCLAQRLPGERLVWDSASMRITNSERANRFVDPAYRAAYAT